MLDQLVESRNNFGDGARRGSFLLTTLVLVVSVFAGGILWSLFAKDLGVGNESLELSTLVAPVPQNEPPLPEPLQKQAKQEQSIETKSILPSRRENIARLDEIQPVPDKISNVPNLNRERPKGVFTISKNEESDGQNPASRNAGDNIGSSGSGIVQNSKPDLAEESETEEPPRLQKPTPVPVSKPKAPISLGVINGKATNLPKPPYPPAAKLIRAAGDVNVQVTIDENGNVISARAISGHPLLKQVSENAARDAKFNPTLLSNQPVKVTGIIIYKFSAQ